MGLLLEEGPCAARVRHVACDVTGGPPCVRACKSYMWCGARQEGGGLARAARGFLCVVSKCVLRRVRLCGCAWLASAWELCLYLCVFVSFE